MEKRRFSGTPGIWPVFTVLMPALVGHAFGCGMFSIRNPIPPPDGGVGCPPPLVADNAANVLTNFGQAVRCKVDGIGQYQDALAEGFFLVLDLIDVQELGTVDSLNRLQDVNAQQLLSTDSPDSFYFAFGEQTPERTTDTTAFYLDIPYELQIIDQQRDSLLTTISGKAEISLAEDPETLNWSITRWVDKREEPNKSFGRWHGERAIQQARRRRDVLK